MSLKDDIIAQIQACAEAATGGSELARQYLKLGFGTIGQQFQFRGETRTKGQAYTVPGPIDCVLEGAAAALLPRTNVIEELENAGPGNISAGHFVVIAGNNEIRRGLSTDPTSSFLGIATGSAVIGAKTGVQIAGPHLARLEAALTINAGDDLFPSASQTGLLTNTGARAVAQVLDASTYPGQVLVVLRIRL